mmetsp:Transcript_41429/g.123779  ORF Transcript_41429/g.123779 Transcript_41429/m.123779 type:complete len:220 (-) Transcript_41429:323-982(-)
MLAHLPRRETPQQAPSFPWQTPRARQLRRRALQRRLRHHRMRMQTSPPRPRLPRGHRRTQPGRRPLRSVGRACVRLAWGSLESRVRRRSSCTSAKCSRRQSRTSWRATRATAREGMRKPPQSTRTRSRRRRPTTGAPPCSGPTWRQLSSSWTGGRRRQRRRAQKPSRWTSRIARPTCAGALRWSSWTTWSTHFRMPAASWSWIRAVCGQSAPSRVWSRW